MIHAQPDFPTYQDRETAAKWGCFSCHARLDPDKMQDKGYPPGRGQYAIQCDHCQAYKFFDLSEKPA